MSFDPLTAREALMQIRLELAQPVLDSETTGRLDQLCRLGLNRNGMENYTVSDRLADCLAQAHVVLEKVSVKAAKVEESPSEGMNLRSEIAEALALPPDIEAMLERRKVR